PLQIGGDSIFGQHFAGMIDEVRVYNVALTQVQIQSDMNTAIPSPGGSTPAVTSLQCFPNTISSGASSTCTVTIAQVAPASGVIVTLSDNSAALSTPASVTVAAGTSTATFNVTAGSVTADTAVTISASLNQSS